MKYIPILLFLFASVRSTAQQSTGLNDHWILWDIVKIEGPLYSNALPRMVTIEQNHHLELRKLHDGRQQVDTTDIEELHLGGTDTLKNSSGWYEVMQAKETIENAGFTIHNRIYQDQVPDKPIATANSRISLEGDRLIWIVTYKEPARGIHFITKGIFIRKEW